MNSQPLNTSRTHSSVPTLSPSRIVCAANQHKDTQEIVIGVRHFCPMMHQNIRALCTAQGIDAGDASNTYAMGWRLSTQGFIDQHGRFFSRESAWIIADTNNQIYRDRDWQTGSLHSEHLY